MTKKCKTSIVCSLLHPQTEYASKQSNSWIIARHGWFTPQALEGNSSLKADCSKSFGTNRIQRFYVGYQNRFQPPRQTKHCRFGHEIFQDDGVRIHGKCKCARKSRSSSRASSGGARTRRILVHISIYLYHLCIHYISVFSLYCR